MTPGRGRLLLVNWQDAENPQAGGAEIHLHEIFGRLADRGWRITLLCSGWPGADPYEAHGGLEIHRVGGRYSFALSAAPYFRRRLADRRFDLVVEDINKIPLFTPLWSRIPVVALVPHLFGTTAFREASPPLAAAVWLAERPLPLVYRDVPFQAISRSTATDLTERGIPAERIRVIVPGIDHARYRPAPDADVYPTPTFVYVGRLKRYKGLEVVIDALGRLRGEGVPARLVIAGRGDHEEALRRHAAGSAPDAVEFRGFVTEEEKIDLLRRGWATVYPSPKEGWGITNVEAAACGTPVIASDAPGLRESVSDGRSGTLVPHRDVAAWARALGRIAGDAAFRERLREGALRFAERFSWDRAADETEMHLAAVLESTPRPGASGPNEQRRSEVG